MQKYYVIITSFLKIKFYNNNLLFHDSILIVQKLLKGGQ